MRDPTSAPTPTTHSSGGGFGALLHRSSQKKHAVSVDNANNVAPAPATPKTAQQSATPTTRLGRVQAWLRQSLSRDSFDEHSMPAPMTSNNVGTPTTIAQGNGAVATAAVSTSGTDGNGTTTTSTTRQTPFGSLVARLSGRRPKPREKPDPLTVTLQLDKRETMSEEDLVSKSLAIELPTSARDRSSLIQSAYSEESVYTSQQAMAPLSAGGRTPSYIRVSCALSGYRTRSQPSLLHVHLGPMQMSAAPATQHTPMIYDKHFAERAAGVTNGDTSRYGTPQTARPAVDQSNRTQTASAPAPISAGRSYVERRLDKFEKLSSTPRAAPQTSSTAAQEPVAETSVRALVADYASRQEQTPVATTARSTRPMHRPPPVPAAPLSTLSESSATTRSVMADSSNADEPTVSSLVDDDGAAACAHSSSPSASNSAAAASIESNNSTGGDARMSIGHLVDYDAALASLMNDAVIDGALYAQSAALLRHALTAQCDELEALTMQQPDEICEEASGAIRIATGKARLLLTKKLAKFDELVANHFAPPSDTANAPTTLLTDLSGFWDLMSIDVEDVRACFEAVAAYERNKWRPLTPEQANSIASGGKSAARRRPVVPSPSATKKPTATAAAPANDERRRRLQEAKAAARGRMAQATATVADDANDVHIFAS